EAGQGRPGRVPALAVIRRDAIRTGAPANSVRSRIALEATAKPTARIDRESPALADAGRDPHLLGAGVDDRPARTEAAVRRPVRGVAGRERSIAGVDEAQASRRLRVERQYRAADAPPRTLRFLLARGFVDVAAFDVAARASALAIDGDRVGSVGDG